MAHYRWRVLIAVGLVAGLVSGIVLVPTLDQGPLVVLLGGIAGIGIVLIFQPRRHGFPDSIMAGGAFGVPLWAVVSVIVIPVLMGDGPQWRVGEVDALFPALIGWILFGALAGLLNQTFLDLAARYLQVTPIVTTTTPATRTRIVVVGGGFGGVTTAHHLEREFGPDPSVSLTLVSDSNSMLFKPMLAEVAASSLEASHISTPLRTSLRRTRVVRGRMTGIDLEERRILLDDGDERCRREEPFDHLVLALGSVTNYYGRDNIEAASFEFMSLSDAIQMRNHVIEMFERADQEPDPVTRQALVTFVVAGGGFGGAELAGALNDFARGMAVYYPAVAPDDVRIILVHSRDRILPELSEKLAEYALERMADRGVTFKLNTRIADVRSSAVVLDPEEEIRTKTFAWTAGTRPNPLIATLPFNTDRRGRIVVDGMMQVPEHPRIWAIGDCAAVPNGEDGRSSPPTAQFATRQAQTLAYNIRATVKNKPLKQFQFRELGTLCVVGHHTACAEIRGWQFSGLFAWFVWRAVYLAKLPGLERKAHVLGDWVIELFFPRDIAQTITLPDRRK